MSANQLEHLPNFAGIKTYLHESAGEVDPLVIREKALAWVNKLESWCKEAFDRIDEVEASNDTYRLREEEIEAREEENESALRALEMLEDHRRGIRTLDEVYEAAGVDKDGIT